MGVLTSTVLQDKVMGLSVPTLVLSLFLVTSVTEQIRLPRGTGKTATDLWASELGQTLQRIDRDLGRQVDLEERDLGENEEEAEHGVARLKRSPKKGMTSKEKGSKEKKKHGK